MFKVGVTGGIGSGKTTACRIFAVLGIPVFSSDEQGKRLLAADPDVRAAVQVAFGDAVMKDGVPDRKALAERVFRDPEALARLNAIIHPAVRSAFSAWAERQDAPYVINEAAILVETGIYRQLDHLVVVMADREERLRRVMERDGLPREAVLNRMRNQATDAERERAANSLLRNDGSNLLIPQVLALHAKLLHLPA
jgi:dephospho-CoA kinase